MQMSGYGYHNRGAPLWLLRELEKRRKDIKIFGVFFHELFAFGPPWTSAFWLSPMQRYICRQLAELSDFWMTSREGSSHWLRRNVADKPHAVMPIFSTIGEPTQIRQMRLPRIVVFGSADLRRLTYEAAGDRLFLWARRWGLEIHDIGAPIKDSHLAKTMELNGVVQHGRLEDGSITDLMGNAQFGLLAYPVAYVAKSSVFAAYCTNGVCPILLSKNYDPVDFLIAGKHYLPGMSGPISTSAAEACGKAAWEWYQPHNLACHVASLKKLIANSSAK